MNENQITCDICRDLLPLVQDGVASADSEAAVLRHVKECGECGALFNGKVVPAVPASESPKALLRVKRWLNGIYAALMLFGIYFGLSLTAGEDMFLNCVIMPVVGVFGYLAFRWRSLFTVPVILLIINVILNVLGVYGGVEDLGFTETMAFTLIYLPFALAGIVIAMLLHFAFGKWSKEKSEGGQEK